MQMKYIPPFPTRPPGLLHKTATIITTVVLAGVALIFSAVLLAAVLIVAAFGGAYLLWKARQLRKLMQSIPPHSQPMGGDAFAGEVFKGDVIEGEVIRVDKSRAAGRL